VQLSCVVREKILVGGEQSFRANFSLLAPLSASFSLTRALALPKLESQFGSPHLASFSLPVESRLPGKASFLRPLPISSAC
jgi:hypothetical protein